MRHDAEGGGPSLVEDRREDRASRGGAFGMRRFIRIQDYIDGYGLGELSPADLQDVLAEASKKFGLLMRGGSRSPLR